AFPDLTPDGVRARLRGPVHGDGPRVGRTEEVVEPAPAVGGHGLVGGGWAEPLVAAEFHVFLRDRTAHLVRPRPGRPVQPPVGVFAVVHITVDHHGAGRFAQDVPQSRLVRVPLFHGRGVQRGAGELLVRYRERARTFRRAFLP